MSWLDDFLRPVIQALGVVQPNRPAWNFGSGFTVTDNPGLNRSDIAFDQSINPAATETWVPSPLVGQATLGLKTSVTTTTNATTAIETFPLPDVNVTSIYATVTAHQTAGTSSPDGAEFQLKGVWRRDGGSPVQIKAPSVVDSNPNASGTAWTAVLLISGNNVLINVTGDTSKTVSWTCTRVAVEGA